MKKIKFAIIGPHTKNSRDLAREIRKRGHSASVLKLTEIVLEFSGKNSHAVWKNKNLESYDIFLFRAYSIDLPFAQNLARLLLKRGKTIIDQALAYDFIPSKAYEASRFSSCNFNFPATFQTLEPESYGFFLKKLRFPLIVKPVNGRRGRGIRKLETKKEFLKFTDENPRGFLVQQYLKINCDIRVFVVGNKVLGAMKRYIPENDFRSNAIPGTRAEKIKLTGKLKSLALRATRAMKYEVSGVDIAEHDNKLYLLEVNSAPQWQKFKYITGINPAEYIVEYALKKYLKKTNALLDKNDRIG